MAYNPYYGQHVHGVQYVQEGVRYVQGVQSGNQYRYQDEGWVRGRARGRDQSRPREAHSRGRTPRASRDDLRDDPLRGSGHLGTPVDDEFYERVRRRMDVGKDSVFDDNFDRTLKEAWARLDRAEKEAGMNRHHPFPRPMPPHGPGKFDHAPRYAPVPGWTPRYVPDYGYSPDPPRSRSRPPPRSRSRTPPRSRSRPSQTQPCPPLPQYRDRARSTDQSGGRRRQRRRSRSRRTEAEPVWYVYVGTTDPDGEILDGYDGYNGKVLYDYTGGEIQDGVNGYDGEIVDSYEGHRNKERRR